MSKEASIREKLRQFRPLPSALYSAIDLNRLTVFTIYTLRREDVPATIENIAVANYKMFPRRFAMVGFPEYPDVLRVNRALLQLRPKYRNWATGNTKLGWALTTAGIAEAKALSARLGDAVPEYSASEEDLEAEPAGVSKRTIHDEDVIKRIRATSLFEKAQTDWQDVGALEVFDVLEAYTHTPAEVLRRKLRELKRIAAGNRDEEVKAVLSGLEERFPSLFGKK